MSASADALQSLVQAFAAIPDPRNPLGRRHSLSALLSLLVVGFAAGCNTLSDFAPSGCARANMPEKSIYVCARTFPFSA